MTDSSTHTVTVNPVRGRLGSCSSCDERNRARIRSRKTGAGELASVATGLQAGSTKTVGRPFHERHPHSFPILFAQDNLAPNLHLIGFLRLSHRRGTTDSGMVVEQESLELDQEMTPLKSVRPRSTTGCGPLLRRCTGTGPFRVASSMVPASLRPNPPTLTDE